MIRTVTPSNPNLIDHGPAANEEDFLHQDEQKFLQSIQLELDQLLREPSEMIIKNILTYARLR